MIPINQTKFHDPENGINGNCMAAALASILELPLSEVPEFEDMGMADPTNKKWFSKFLDWLFDLGFELLVWNKHVPLKGYYLASGMSKRGYAHQVVYKNGFIIHDPHPDDTGIITFIGQWALLPLNPVYYKININQGKAEMIKYNCPECKHPLCRVVQSHSGKLNQDQFDAVKAGDYVCEAGCRGGRGKSGLRYYWERELNGAGAISIEIDQDIHSNMIEALEILERFNPLRNDLDAYLLDVVEWAQCKGSKPNPEDFGIIED